MPTQHIMNDAVDLVQQALNGHLRCNPNLARLDGFPDIKVVLDTRHDKSTHVALISGGGSGHEPAHAGYVGRGMLSAAVCGEVFASPSAEAVLAAIRAVTGPPGCLLIVKNYTGDRLHFGLAAELAKAEGYAVQMVVVAEDVAIDSPGLAGRRGLAGTVLVHKVAGAVAASGGTLGEVVAAAKRIADGIATMGSATRVCTLPGHPPSQRLTPGEMELGLGIHGEPGVEMLPVPDARSLVATMLNKIRASPFWTAQEGQRVALLVNNLGATTPLELGCVVGEALAYLEGTLHLPAVRCWAGPLMTSLDMAGFSLTLLALPRGPEGDDVLAALDAPVDAPGWPRSDATVVPLASLPVPQGPTEAVEVVQEGVPPAAAEASGQLLARAIQGAAQALVAGREQLNALDAQVGDGDCGDTVAHGARAVLADLAAGRYPLGAGPAPTIAALARSVRHAVGGTSGALYDIGLSAAARALKESAGAVSGCVLWASALKAAVGAVEQYGGAGRGSRTMLDALFPALEELEEQTRRANAPAAAVAAAVAQAAQGGAAATADMTAAAGRASYVAGAALRSTPDPGAVAVSLWLGGLAGALQ